MKKYIIKANEHCKRFTRHWDSFAAGMDAYMGGYIQAREDAGQPELGIEEVEYITPPGDQQLSDASFKKWYSETKSQTFRDTLQKQLNWYEFSDIRIVEKDGEISFQGKARKKG